MNRREWIGAMAGLAASMPSGAALGTDVLPTGDLPEIIDYQPFTIVDGTSLLKLEWIRCLKQTNVFGDFWHWQWKEKTNDNPWFIGECTTNEPRIAIMGGKLTVSVREGLEFIWNG